MSEREYDLAIVIPVHNEAENIRPLYSEILQARDAMPKRIQIVFVDDGSTDDSDSVLAELAERDNQIVVVRLGSNRGQTTALRVGFQAARAKFLVPLDGDRQNDPSDIPKLLAALEESGSECQAVCGWRRSRQDGFWAKRLPSRMGNWMARQVTRSPVHDTACTLKAMRADAAKAIPLYADMHRFIPVLLSQQYGLRTIREIPVNHRARPAGRSKYGWGRIGRVLRDIETISLLWRLRGWSTSFVVSALATVAAMLLLWPAGAIWSALAAVFGVGSLALRQYGMRCSKFLAESAIGGPIAVAPSPQSRWPATFMYVGALILTAAALGLSIVGVAGILLTQGSYAASTLLGLGLALVAPAGFLRLLAQWEWLRRFAGEAALAAEASSPTRPQMIPLPADGEE